MKKVLLFGLILTIGLSFISTTELHSQTELDEKAYLNFDEGIGFIAPDSTLGLNMRFRMQNRLGVTFEDGWDDSEFEMAVRRARLRFDGFIKNQKITYSLQLSFSRGDQDWDNSKIPNVLRDAMVFYKFNKKFYIGFGQGKLPSNRQRVISSGSQQFTDRSLVNSIFTVDRDFGVFAYYNNKLVGNFHYEIKGAISSGEGRNIVKTDNGLAYTGRIELLPLGKFTNKGDYFEGDLEREITPKISLAAAYSYNNKAIKTQGQRGSELYDPKDIESIFVDFVFKYNGWAFSSEFAQRNVDNPFTYSLSDMRYIYTGSGINNQLSYIFKNNYEIAGRYTHIKPSSQMSIVDAPTQDVLTLGLTKYICSHKAKMQFNVSRIYENRALDINDKKLWNAMIQLEIGI